MTDSIPAVKGRRATISIALVALLATFGCNRETEVLRTCTFVASGRSSVFLETKERFTVEYDSSAMGVFVKSIDGVAQTKTAYWLYYVNGEPSGVSSDKFIPAAGDTIEWRLVSCY